MKYGDVLMDIVHVYDHNILHYLKVMDCAKKLTLERFLDGKTFFFCSFIIYLKIKWFKSVLNFMKKTFI
jgi:hypothetical protein